MGRKFPKTGDAVVLGAGVSGLAAARLLLRRGWRATLLDEGSEPRLGSAGTPEAERAKTVAALREEGVSVSFGATALPAGKPALVVLSPGIPPSSRLRRAADSCGALQWSELELGWRRLECPMIAVTGSKGKSSLVKLIADTLALAGKRVAIGGNYGTPLSSVALESAALDWVVVECSSFQLEAVEMFRPDIGIVLNLSPDHLDRHGTMAAYLGTKLRLLARQRGSDVALLPAADDDDWELAATYAKVGGGRPHKSFGLSADADWRYEAGKVSAGGEWGQSLDIANSAFDNPVLGPAAAAGVAALTYAGVDAEVIQRGFAEFTPLPHRMQLVVEIDGVRYVNDSKATSFAALLAALSMTVGRVRLIAGGRLKGSDLPTGKELVTRGVIKAYLIGESAGALASEWASHLEIQACGTMEEAVASARREARPGDTVLLSPGAASYDQFTSFEERGQRFVDCVTRQKV
jgi:UDP-N-acetylmuramoylalanine--D-glutamate ligase